VCHFWIVFETSRSMDLEPEHTQPANEVVGDRRAHRSSSSSTSAASALRQSALAEDPPSSRRSFEATRLSFLHNGHSPRFSLSQPATVGSLPAGRGAVRRSQVDQSRALALRADSAHLGRSSGHVATLPVTGVTVRLGSLPGRIDDRARSRVSTTQPHFLRKTTRSCVGVPRAPSGSSFTNSNPCANVSRKYDSG